MDERAIKVLEIIIKFGPISGPNILAYLQEANINMNIKTLFRMIERWNFLFEHIGNGTMAIVGVKNKGYYLNYDYFTEAEYRFFVDAIESSSLLEKKEKDYLKNLCLPFSAIGTAAKKETDHNGFLDKLRIVQHAINQFDTLKFSYLDYYIKEDGKKLSIEKKYRNHGNDLSDHSKETYLISPYEIMMHKGQYYVLSYCDKHPDNLTIFRIDRMEKLRLARNSYFHQLKDIVDYDKKKQQMVNMFVGTAVSSDIRIKFEAEIFKTIIDQFGTDIQLSRDVDGKPIFELQNFAISEGLISWIMMMGDKVEVLAPNLLKKEIYQRLEALLARYQSS